MMLESCLWESSSSRQARHEGLLLHFSSLFIIVIIIIITFVFSWGRCMRVCGARTKILLLQWLLIVIISERETKLEKIIIAPES